MPGSAAADGLQLRARDEFGGAAFGVEPLWPPRHRVHGAWVEPGEKGDPKGSEEGPGTWGTPSPGLLWKEWSWHILADGQTWVFVAAAAFLMFLVVFLIIYTLHSHKVCIEWFRFF